MGAASSVADITTTRTSRRLHQRERQIGVEMALMKFVEHHDADAAQLRIRQKPARQNPFGEKSQTRARTADIFEPNLIADGIANAFAQFARHSPRRHARSQTPGFQHQHFARSKASSAGGTRVVFPAPGGASITRDFDVRSASTICGSSGSIGSFI